MSVKLPGHGARRGEHAKKGHGPDAWHPRCSRRHPRGDCSLKRHPDGVWRTRPAENAVPADFTEIPADELADVIAEVAA